MRQPRTSWFLHLGIALLLPMLNGSDMFAAEVSTSASYYQKLTLAPPEGGTVDPAGPLYYHRSFETTRTWALTPIFSYSLDNDTDWEEFDFVYPILSYDRFGSEYRFHIFQVFSFSGGKTQSETNVNRFTLFPIYFQQRSDNPELNYTGLVPIYGKLRNHLFRDEARWIMLPIYLQTRKRDIVTDNYVYPIFHLRHGDGLKGWQFWPIMGREHKEVTTKTNVWGDLELTGGHDKLFVLWPFYLNNTTEIGTENPQRQKALLPLYLIFRSPLRDSSTYLWPFGYTRTVDRGKGYTETAAPWPFIIFAHGPGKQTRRVFPFFSQASNANLESDFYMWPIYKYNRIKADPLDRERTRILFFLYSDVREKNTETGTARTRKDFWPFFTSYRDFNGDSHFQVLAVLEPFLPNNKSIERNYSPVWALWRTEKTPRVDGHATSFLWNLYRRESSRDHKKLSLLFGLFQYQSGPDGRRWRVFHIPVGKKPHAENAPVVAK